MLWFISTTCHQRSKLLKIKLFASNFTSSKTRSINDKKITLCVSAVTLFFIVCTQRWEYEMWTVYLCTQCYWKAESWTGSRYLLPDSFGQAQKTTVYTNNSKCSTQVTIMIQFVCCFCGAFRLLFNEPQQPNCQNEKQELGVSEELTPKTVCRGRGSNLQTS